MCGGFKRTMTDGRNCWEKQLLEGMTEVFYSGQKFFSFRNMPQSLYHGLAAACASFKDKPALVDDAGAVYSYASFVSLVDRLAVWLTETGRVRKGDKVAVVFYSTPEFCAFFFALSKLGAVAVLIPTKYKEEEILSLLEKSGAKLVLCGEPFRNFFYTWEAGGHAVLSPPGGSGESGGLTRLNALVPEQSRTEAAAGLEDDALMLFTSGTTSHSKGVLLKNYNIIHAILTYQRVLNITGEDRGVIPIPIYTITGSVALLGLFLLSGGTLWLHKKFDAERVLSCAAENRLTFIHASPTVFSLLLDKRDQFPSLPSLRAFACGSSNMPAENIRRLKQWLPNAAFRTIYGLTETSSPGTVFPSDAALSPFIGSSGLPIPGLELKICGPGGDELPAGEAGEICLRGAVVIRNYFFGGSDAFTADGWLKTGDMGYVNQQGYLYVIDRIKDIINRGGEKIASFDVENALHHIPGIIEAAVIGIPHARYGEEPAALIRLEKGAAISENEIREKLKKTLANYMVPAQIRFVDSLPKTPNGKIDKKGLRASWARD
jgi:fatty-acyl-CoA synthase/long-chain acyl-CoA synthetase